VRAAARRRWRLKGQESVGSAPPLQVHTARDKVSNADLCSLTGVVHLLEALFPEDFTFSW
jgi:hypothetical protein